MQKPHHKKKHIQPKTTKSEFDGFNFAYEEVNFVDASASAIARPSARSATSLP
jgi:hypothetical protein